MEVNVTKGFKVTSPDGKEWVANGSTMMLGKVLYYEFDNGEDFIYLNTGVTSCFWNYLFRYKEAEFKKATQPIYIRDDYENYTLNITDGFTQNKHSIIKIEFIDGEWVKTKEN